MSSSWYNTITLSITALLITTKVQYLFRISWIIIAVSNGTGVNIDTIIGDTSDMSASGCGRENFISTMGIPAKNNNKKKINK